MITSVTYSDENEKFLHVTKEDEQEVLLVYPLNGSHDANQVQLWLDEGNTIVPYSPPA